MIAAVAAIDLGRASEFRHHDYQRVALSSSTFGQVVEERGEWPVELAELFDVKIEILEVGIVVRVVDLDEGHRRFPAARRRAGSVVRTRACRIGRGSALVPPRGETSKTSRRAINCAA